ncbi:MAG: DNA methyltransferase, partial [Blastocatellia bacterium]
GTTIVECTKKGIPSIGIEANPMAHFASEVKIVWDVDPDGLLADAGSVADVVQRQLEDSGVEDEPLPLFKTLPPKHQHLLTLPNESFNLLLTDSISPLPLHKTLVLIECLQKHSDEKYRHHQMLALAKALVFSISNLHFGPEVGIGPAKSDVAVIPAWMSCVKAMVEDLRELAPHRNVPATVRCADARSLGEILEPGSIDAVITSPPYPNEKDYTRTTRLESVLLGFIRNKADLRALKNGLMRSNTRNVYKDDDDDQWVNEHPEIQRIAEAIEARRIELGKTSGFERLYARVTRLYFGGMARHLAELRHALRPGAHLAYVVGDQASYLRVMIRTGQLLADIAQSLGYEVIDIDLFRTRLATATKEQLREEVVVLRWPGNSEWHDKVKVNNGRKNEDC